MVGAQSPDMSHLSDDDSEAVVDVQTAEGDGAGGHLLRRGRSLLVDGPYRAAAGRSWYDGVVEVFVERTTARVHEEVCHRRHFESQLLGDRRLHVLVRSTGLLEDGEQRAALDVGEDKTWFLVDLVDDVWVAVRGGGGCGGVRQAALVMLQ